MDNQHLAEMILKQIDTFPESFAMNQWGSVTSCGTIACIAGHAMLQCGYQLTEDTRTDWTGIRYQVFLYADQDDKLVVNYGDEAQKLLGMSNEERFLPSGDIFLDMTSGLQRFRELAKEGRDELCKQRVSVINGCFITHGDSHGDITCSASGYPATARELAKGQA